MILRSFKTIADSVTNANFKEVYSIIADKEKTFVADSLSEVPVSQNDMTRIQTLLNDQVRANLVQDGVSFQLLEEARKDITSVLDGFVNPMTGTGVSGVDPGMFNRAQIPVSMSPNEATAYYSSGGLPQIIIDKKSKGALLNGYHFESDAHSEEDKKKLKEYAQSINFDSALETVTRDGLIYGGALLYPKLKKDNLISLTLPLNELLDKGIIDKDCIDYFVTVDRWNAIMIPDYDITARDYLMPNSFYIPIGGVRVATARCAVIRPKKLPYWGAIRQIGWGASDYEGYIRSILAYKIIIMSVPIMAQQMSLLVHEIPLDGIIAQNGPEFAEKFAQANSLKMRGWSMNNPVTINSFGELKAINRQYSQYAELIQSVRQDVGADSGIPEAVLFHTMPKGFSDNTADNTIKQSETIKNINNSLLPSLGPIVRMLVYGCFGRNSEQARYCDRIRLSFDTPEVVTSEEKGKLLDKFSAAVNMFKTAGATLTDSIALAKCFIPDMKFPEDLLNSIKNTVPPPSPAPGTEDPAGGKTAPFMKKEEGEPSPVDKGENSVSKTE